jgi:hypothetical protein
MVGFGSVRLVGSVVGRDHQAENKKPDSNESGLAVVISGSFSRGALFQRKTIVAKPTRASVRV